MRNGQYEKNNEMLFELLDEVPLLPEEDVNNISEFINHDEGVLAFEVLCTQIYEYDINISSEYYDKLCVVGKIMGMDSSEREPLKELVKPKQT